MLTVKKMYISSLPFFVLTELTIAGHDYAKLIGLLLCLF